MPVPDVLRSLIRNPAFWSDFLGEEVYQNEYSSLVDSSDADEFPVRIRLPITPGYGLTLRLNPWLSGFFLELVEVQQQRGATIAYDACDGHALPYGLRWKELDLFGRCLALRDPEWYHPGLLVLFLSIATPVTSEEDAALAFPLLESAWQSLGLYSGRRLARLVQHQDRRHAGMEWHCHDLHGWELRQAHTPRRADNERFPFSGWQSFVVEAEQVLRHAGSPARVPHNHTVATLARILADRGEWEAAPMLADALMETGVDHPTVLGNLCSGVPARILWVVEGLLGIPIGQLIKDRLGTPVRNLEPSHRLEIQFPAGVDDRMIWEFKRTLVEEGIGQSSWQGGVCHPPAEGPMPEEAFRTTIVGDLAEGLEAIRRVFAKYGPPLGTGIFSYTEYRHLPVMAG